MLEPRSNTLRRNVFADALVEALSLADEVVLASVFKSENIPEAERLVPEAVAEELRQGGTPALALADAGAIVTEIAPRLRAGDVVAILSNGGFGNIYKLLPQTLATGVPQPDEAALR